MINVLSSSQSWDKHDNTIQAISIPALWECRVTASCQATNSEITPELTTNEVPLVEKDSHMQDGQKTSKNKPHATPNKD